MKRNKFWKLLLIYSICFLALFNFSISHNNQIYSEVKKVNQTGIEVVTNKNVKIPLVSNTNRNIELKNIATTENNSIDIWNNLSEEGKCEYKERILLLVLHPYIQEAVNNYYGENRQYDNPTIVYIVPKLLDHIIEIQVSTFSGAHNPPYGEDNIQFKINSSKIQLLDFSHKNK